MENKKHGQGKHMFLMLLCCLVPLLLIIGIKFFNIGGSTISRFAPMLFPILCMGMHLLILKGMMGHGKGCCHDDKDENQNHLG